VRNRVPRIHDITTNVENPPEFSAVLPARAAENAAAAAYAGSEVAKLQKAAYPDIAPLELRLPAAKAFDLALSAARSMLGWDIVASDPATGRIEASQASRWFRFTDDVVIRVAPCGSGSRNDKRSLHRPADGAARGDVGARRAVTVPCRRLRRGQQRPTRKPAWWPPT